mgnify:CR=1 FL=1
MEMFVKERVFRALKKKNYFEHEKKDSLEILKKAEHFEDIIIQVERNCNFDNLLFRYNPTDRKFHRVVLTEKDKELLCRESKYNVHHKCIKRKCLNKEIDVHSFIKLLDFVFEPVAVYNVSDFNI